MRSTSAPVRGRDESGFAGPRCRSAAIREQSKYDCARKGLRTTHEIPQVRLRHVPHVARQVVLLQPVLLSSNIGRLDPRQQLRCVLNQRPQYRRPHIHRSRRESKVQQDLVSLREVGSARRRVRHVRVAGGGYAGVRRDASTTGWSKKKGRRARRGLSR